MSSRWTGPVHVAVVGAGYMGCGIAQVLADAGHQVALADIDATRAARALELLIDSVQGQITAGLIAADVLDRIRSNVRAAADLGAAAAGAELVLEAVYEDRAVKLEVLGKIAEAAGADAVIGTNTSAIPISDLAQAVPGAHRFLGIHWMNPAPFIPGVEIIPTGETDPAIVSRVVSLLRAAGKIPATVSDSPGFVANRLQMALYHEAIAMVEEGLASPAQIDAVVANTFGFRLAIFGPFAIGDMAGLDVYAAAFETLAKEYGERFRAPVSLTERVAAGDLGVKTGGGFAGLPSARRDDLVAYRERAYSRLATLRGELGDSPLGRGDADE